MTTALELAQQLISNPSVTPNDAGCQQQISEILSAAGFNCETMQFEKVTNLWARHGTEGPVVCFLGHTDVVPAGDLEKWKHDPFKPVIEDSFLYGRGSADMKGALAAMVIAAKEFVVENPNHNGSIALLVTSDEEGVAINGTTKVIDVLEERQEKITWCIVGEPSCTAVLGDTIKNGRRGSMVGEITIKGLQGHVAYPHLAKNAIHLALPIFDEIANLTWDKGNEFFPASNLQFANFNSGTGATNVIPGTAKAQFAFRFSPLLTPEEIQQKIIKVLDNAKVEYEVEWFVKGVPFFTKPGKLTKAVAGAVKEITRITPELSTAGGTSDGRFVAPTGAEVVELGTINATIHQINERVAADDIEKLKQIYKLSLQNLLS